MQLRNHNALSTINHKCTVICHIGNGTQKNILDHSVKFYMVRVGTILFQFCLQRHTVCETSFKTLINCVTRGVNIIIQELQNEVIPGIIYREILTEYLIQAIVLTKLWWCI